MLTLEQMNGLNSLNVGDVFTTIHGAEYSFVEMKRKYVHGTSLKDGKTYRVPVDSFDKVVKRVDRKAKAAEYRSLTRGELFYIAYKGDTVLYKFEGEDRGKIIGINPISNSRTKIDPALYGGKVSDL